MDLTDIIQRITTRIREETFDEGDILTLDIGDDITLEEEREIYLAAKQALQDTNNGFVKLRTRRKATA